MRLLLIVAAVMALIAQPVPVALRFVTAARAAVGVPIEPGIEETANFAAIYRETGARMLATGCPYATWITEGRHFLFFDPSGDGQTAEVFGDLSTATKVAVLVPGVATNLGNFERGLGGVARRAPGMQGRTLYQQLSRRSPGVAVISWLGYDPPKGIGVEAATYGRARAGAAALDTFVDGLLRRRPGITVTLVGHSYGSLVVGLAAPRLPQVSDLIALGSPGMGVSRASDLGGATVWSALAARDWIRRVPQARILGIGLGKRPSSRGFGARELPTDGVKGHDYYLVEGSATLRAVTDVVLSGGTGHAGPGRV